VLREEEPPACESCGGPAPGAHYFCGRGPLCDWCARRAAEAAAERERRDDPASGRGARTRGW
jgi:hypothetical protein